MNRRQFSRCDFIGFLCDAKIEQNRMSLDVDWANNPGNVIGTFENVMKFQGVCVRYYCCYTHRIGRPSLAMPILTGSEFIDFDVREPYFMPVVIDHDGKEMSIDDIIVLISSYTEIKALDRASLGEDEFDWPDGERSAKCGRYILRRNGLHDLTFDGHELASKSVCDPKGRSVFKLYRSDDGFFIGAKSWHSINGKDPSFDTIVCVKTQCLRPFFGYSRAAMTLYRDARVG